MSSTNKSSRSSNSNSNSNSDPKASAESSPSASPSKKIKVEHTHKNDGDDAPSSSSSLPAGTSPQPRPDVITSSKSGSGSGSRPAAAATASSSSSTAAPPAASSSSLPPPPPLPNPSMNIATSNRPANAPVTANTAVTQIQITRHDVLLGRGGGTNKHAGNIAFRNLVCEHQPAYVQSRKKDKSIIAKRIVTHIRNLNGRFLKLDNDNGTGAGTVWIDVGDKRATEKTSQALREGLSGRMRDIVHQSGKGLKQLKTSGLVGAGKSAIASASASKKGILDQDADAANANAKTDEEPVMKKTGIVAASSASSSKQDKEKGGNGASKGDDKGPESPPTEV